jgi:hypothetical protein
MGSVTAGWPARLTSADGESVMRPAGYKATTTSPATANAVAVLATGTRNRVEVLAAWRRADRRSLLCLPEGRRCVVLMVGFTHSRLVLLSACRSRLNKIDRR